MKRSTKPDPRAVRTGRFARDLGWPTVTVGKTVLDSRSAYLRALVKQPELAHRIDAELRPIAAQQAATGTSRISMRRDAGLHWLGTEGSTRKMS